MVGFGMTASLEGICSIIAGVAKFFYAMIAVIFSPGIIGLAYSWKNLRAIDLRAGLEVTAPVLPGSQPSDEFTNSMQTWRDTIIAGIQGFSWCRK